MRTPEQLKEYHKNYRATHREKMRQYSKKYRDAHKDVPQHLMKKYGITVEDKQAMWDRQEGKCAVCKEPMVHVFDRDCCVDHCHKTSKVRGLIHWYCNILVGVLEAKPLKLEQIIAYVESFK